MHVVTNRPSHGLRLRAARPETHATFDEFIEGCSALEALGVTWLTLAFPARSRSEYLERVDRFGDEVLSLRS